MVLAESPLPPPSPSPSPPPPPPMKESAGPSFTLFLNLIPILMIITFSIYVSCKKNQDQTANIDDTETGTRSEQQQQQQQQVVLEVFRTVIYDKIEEGIIEDLSCRNCTICLEDFQDGDENGIFTKCNHMYHKLYIDKWLWRNERCPLCRGPVRITQNK